MLLILVTGICLFLGTLVTLSTWYGKGVYWYAGLTLYGLAMATLPVVCFFRGGSEEGVRPAAVLVLFCAATFLFVVNRSTFGVIADGNFGAYLTVLLFSGFGGLLMNLTLVANIRCRVDQALMVPDSDPDKPKASNGE